jgi:hypothetical protein
MARECLTDMVAHGCGCNADQADVIIADEADYLRDLASRGDLTMEDMEVAMLDMGVDFDFIEEMLLRI